MQRAEYLAVLFFVKLAKILPISWTFAIFDFFGALLFLALKSRRKIAINNLTLAYPQKNEEEIYALAKANFKSIAKSAAEIILLFNNKKTPEDFIINKDEVIEKLNKATKDNKKGVIFLTAHFGNWEVGPQFIASQGYPCTGIGREGDNKLIEKNFTKPFRERYGNQNIYKKEAMSKMVKTLKSGGNVGLLIDQKAGRTNSVITTFFGRECQTTISVATMKLRYDSLVVPAFAKRESDGRYRIILEGVAEYTAEEKQSKDEKIQAMTQYYNDILERAVREAPEQWFWMHNRWQINP